MPRSEIGGYKKVRMFLTRVFNRSKPLKIEYYCTVNALKLNSVRKMCGDIIKPPECVRGIIELDREKFTREIQVPFVKLIVAPENVSPILKSLKKYLLKLEHYKPIENRTEDGKQVINVYLNPEKVKSWNDIDKNDQDKLNERNVGENNFNLDKKFVLKYENYSLQSIMRAILPPDEEGMASFTKVGHIVHLNLREHLLPYKNVIGAILLDKVSGCKSVVNKINIIDNTYRNFQMEVLCGENNMVTKLKENNCQFEFDFSTVYWNSRLSSEHERIVNVIKENDVLFDVFAGVGPFSIPAAKKKCIVYANDLNPESYKWLNHNIKLNKLNSNFISTFNKDGREFILEDIKINLPKYINKHNIHITMNLPAMAVEFFPLLCKLFKKTDIVEIERPPLVYLYCFTKGEDHIQLAKSLLCRLVGRDISANIIDIFKVRTVSSYKEMVKLTIKLDETILVDNEKQLKRKYDDIQDSGTTWEKTNCIKPSK